MFLLLFCLSTLLQINKNKLRNIYLTFTRLICTVYKFLPHFCVDAGVDLQRLKPQLQSVKRLITLPFIKQINNLCY